MKTLNQIFAAFMVIGAITACEKEDIQANTSSQSQQMGSTSTGGDSGNVKSIEMTGTPPENANDYEDARFEIREIDAYIENQGWVQLNTTSQDFYMSDLSAGSSISLAQNAEIDFKLIKQIRLKFGEDNYLVGNEFLPFTLFEMNFATDNEVIVDVSGQESEDGNIHLAFDFSKSIVESANNYVFDPTIQFLADFETGVKGSVEGANEALVTFRNGALQYESHITATGEFTIRNMEEGTYSMIIQEIGSNDSQMAAVVAVENQLTLISEVKL